jgi:hypothetical protein
MSEKKEGIANLSRRQFLKDAGLVVGGTAVSSVFLLSACGKEIEVTKTVTTTAAQTTITSTTLPPELPLPPLHREQLPLLPIYLSL